MEGMTLEQREEFINSRVTDILTAFEGFHEDISQLSVPGRDEYIQSRMTRDLAVTDAITLKLKQYVKLRDNTWRWMTFVDIIALVTFVGLAIRDIKDIIAFAIVAAVMVASRILNWSLLSELHALLELYETQAHRESNTAALLFLINSIGIIERVKIANGKPAEVGSIVEEATQNDAT